MALLLRFLLLAGLALLVAWADSAGLLRGTATPGRGAYTAETLYLLLPAVLGVTLASFRHARRGAALRLMVLATLLMIATDFLPGSAVASSQATMVRLPGSGATTQAPVQERWNSPGALRWVTRHATGGISREEMAVQRSYPADAVRLQVAHAYAKVAFLLLPAVIAGLVLGAVSWMDRTMLFTSRATETAVEFVLGWLVGPLILVVALAMARQVLSLTLFDGAPPPTVFLPYLALLGISLVGWMTAEVHSAA